jgi:hypothetical protein
MSVFDTSSNTSLTDLGTAIFTPVGTPTPDTNCSNGIPATPVLASAIPIGTNEIKLTWTDVADPVSNYLLAYGLSSGNYIYGNPNIGNQGVTSYIVGSLSSSQKYYFAIKAVNGCMPSSYSNEIGVSTAGTVIVTSTPVATSAKPSTLTNSDDQKSPTDTPTDTSTPIPTNPPKNSPTSTRTSSSSLFSGLISESMIGIIVIVILFVGIGIAGFWQWRKSQQRGY